MDNYKIKKANELYSKIQGALWAKDKMLEYEHYDRAKEVSQKINQWYKEIEGLKLTEEEREKVGYEFVDNDLAERYYWGLRA